jgi:hypothetical protein
MSLTIIQPPELPAWAGRRKGERRKESRGFATVESGK